LGKKKRGGAQKDGHELLGGTRETRLRSRTWAISSGQSKKKKHGGGGDCFPLSKGQGVRKREKSQGRKKKSLGRGIRGIKAETTWNE